MEILKDQKEQQAIRNWWIWLHDEKQRGDRARLRRCNTPDEVMMQPAFHRLCQPLPRIAGFALEGLVLVAGLLAWNKAGGDTALSVILGTSKEGSDKPRFSELRFQQLLAASSPDDFFQALRRALQQSDEKGDPMQLADSILHWHQQYCHPDWYSGSRQWQYQFSRPYYEKIIK